MNQEIRRSYNFSDAILLAHIGKVAEQLPNDLSVIEEEIGSIDQAFLDALKADHFTALREGGDDAAKGKVGHKTQTLLETIEASKKIVKRIRFYVSEAFGDDPARKKSFNLANYWKVVNNQPELIKFMNALAEVVADNRDALIAGGAKDTLIASVEENARALAKADAEQESSKGGRTNSTQARIIALNSLYRRAAKLDEATDIAFEDNPVKASFYNLPQSSSKVDELEEETEKDTYC